MHHLIEWLHGCYFFRKQRQISMALLCQPRREQEHQLSSITWRLAAVVWKKTHECVVAEQKKLFVLIKGKEGGPKVSVCILPVMQHNSRWNWVCIIHQAMAYVIRHTSDRAHNERFMYISEKGIYYSGEGESLWASSSKFDWTWWILMFHGTKSFNFCFKLFLNSSKINKPLVKK